jgi:hypothetical protein
MQPNANLDCLSDDELLRSLDALVSHSRRIEVDLVAHIGEVERRRLYAREACPSMFAYCRERLHLSEAEAYMRIRVARAARRHPPLLDMLRDGRLHLSAIVRLLPVLTHENRDALLARATFCSKRQILEIVAELSPRPDVPARMLRLPQQRQPDRAGVQPADELCPDTVAATPTPTPTRLELSISAGACPGAAFVSSPTRRTVVEPLSPGRYQVQFTASAELHDKLERLRGLMRSQFPDGDLAAVIDHAVSETLARLEARRFAKTSAPRKALSDTITAPASRHVPAAVRRAVRDRDGDRCGFVDTRGRRCTEKDRLEFHHRHPFGMGGDHDPGNVGLLCRTHNQLVARSDYGLIATTRRNRAPGSTLAS